MLKLCVSLKATYLLFIFIKTGDYCPVNASDINFKKPELFKLNKEKKGVLARFGASWG